MTRVDLRTYDNAWYRPGRSVLIRSLWLFFGLPLFRSPWFALSAWRVGLLRLFGARIGQRVVIRQHVTVKYPWHLVVGDDCWIGEQAWIDNLTTTTLGAGVCLSQGAYLCTGNHDWTDPGFGLRVSPIVVDRGAWVGARAMLLPGVHLGEGSIATAGSVVTASVPAWTIVAGNPATFLKMRVLRERESRAARSSVDGSRATLPGATNISATNISATSLSATDLRAKGTGTTALVATQTSEEVVS